MFHYRNREQTKVSRERLVAVIDEVSSEINLVMATGGFCCGQCGSNHLLGWVLELRATHRRGPDGYVFWDVYGDNDFERGGDLRLRYEAWQVSCRLSLSQCSPLDTGTPERHARPRQPPLRGAQATRRHVPLGRQ